MMFLSGLFTMLSVAYRVVDFPDLVGPVTRMAPAHGEGDLVALEGCVQESELLQLQEDRALSRIRMTTFSP